MSQAITVTNNRVGGDKVGHVIYVADTAADNSNKTLTVTAGRAWQIVSLYAKLADTATVGNRQMALIVSGPDGVELYRNAAVAVQTANATEYYLWSPNIETPAETVATFHHLPLPFLYLTGGATVKVYDSAAVDAAADDLTLNMCVVEYGG